jgi:tRNA (cmo5U34)-methyltransferase
MSRGLTDVGDSISADNAAWSFGGEIPKHFQDHVTRSVPLYVEGHDVIVKLSDFFLSEGSICYELGCSTGELIHKIAIGNRQRGIRAIGIDIEGDMIAYARKYWTGTPVTFVHENIVDMDFEPCDLIVSYYTMQFIRPRDRQIVFDRIYESLHWGGALLLFEKVRAADARFQDMMTAMYTDYKLARGYEAEEIVTKARSLKGVLEPFASQANIDMMRRAGFQDIMTVVKYICFEGFLAIK